MLDSKLGGRFYFLAALRFCWPEFWRDLNQAWRKHSDIQEWLRDHHVVDDWLIETAENTIKQWTKAPHSPNAKLHKGYRWYYYDPPQIPEFRPTFDQPYPIYSLEGRDSADFTESPIKDAIQMSREGKKETIKDFKRRMTRQFHQQLNRYAKDVDAILINDLDRYPLLANHAGWTALAFRGKPLAEISREHPEMLSYRNAEATVQTAVDRFAKSIGLTMPSRCGGNCGDSRH